MGADRVETNSFGGNGMENMLGLVEEIRESNSSIPILIHANAGVLEYTDGETMAVFVPLLMEAGANIIGGCCGTTPKHIQAMVGALK